MSSCNFHNKPMSIDIEFSTDNIKNVLKGCDKNKVTSPDEIPIMFYKNLSRSLSFPLKERVLPDKSKTNFITTIFSISCSISKVFERLVFNVLFEKFKVFIHSSRHGFYAKRLTQTNLMEFKGPFLFTIFIDDLLRSLTTSFGYADDLKLLKKVTNGSDCYAFQLEINEIH